MLKEKLKNPEMMLVVTYFVLFAVNSLVILLANSLMPQHVVLGTGNISKGWVLIHAVGSLALINTFAIPVVREFEKMRSKMLTNKEWMMAYFIINFVGVWLVARFANQLGLGISSWVVALALAVVLDFAQGMAMMQMEKLRK